MRAEPILTLDDPRIADYRNLKDGELRHGRSRFIAEGRGVVRCLVSEARFRPSSVFSTPASLRALADLLDAPADYPLYVAEPSLFSEIIGFEFHRGCLAAGDRRPPDGPWHLAGLAAGETAVVMEGLTDPDNVGSVFRNARAFGVRGVLLCPRCCDPLYRKAIRTSMGAALCVPFDRSTSLTASLAALGRAGVLRVALHPRPDATPLDAFLAGLAPDTPIAFVLGTEGAGLSDAALAACDVRVRIDMTPGVDSVNVATAAAIALHGIRTRRAQAGRSLGAGTSAS